MTSRIESCNHNHIESCNYKLVGKIRGFENKSQYTGCPILKIVPKYFFSEAFSEKMFQTKVVWIKGRHLKRVSLI